MTRSGTPAPLRPFVVFGRVPFFFYVVYFYVLGLGAAIVRTKMGLLGTCGVWLLLLGVMAWPCAWDYRKKRDRPNWITRYFYLLAYDHREGGTLRIRDDREAAHVRDVCRQDP